MPNTFADTIHSAQLMALGSTREADKEHVAVIDAKELREILHAAGDAGTARVKCRISVDKSGNTTVALVP